MKRLINNDNDVFVKRCAEQQSEIDELKKENKDLECEYNLLVNNDRRKQVAKVDTENMIAEILNACLSYEQDMSMKDEERNNLMVNLRCIINNNINLTNEMG